ncbi:MAG: hypothetical protein K5897_05495 [Eubacterium sp.]|nr:hypothetical protein [Eubacterium sp.]
MRRKRMINAIRRNKKFTLVLAGVMLTAALCSGCGSSAGETGTGTITETVTEAVTVTPGGAKTYELPENEIIFLDHYTNGAWGMSNNGFYIRSDGRMYQFDFDTVGFSPSRGMQLMDRLALWEKNFEPVGRVELDFLEELYEYGMKIDPNAEMELDPETACDAGEDCLIFRNPETGEMITCYEWGDSTGTLKDRYAKKLVKLWKEEGKGATTMLNSDQGDFSLMTPQDFPITVLERYVGTMDERKGAGYYVKSAEALRKNAESLWGLNAEELLEELDQKVNEGYDANSYGYYDVYGKNNVYFLKFVTFPSTGYVRDTDGFLLGNGTYSFLGSDADRDPAEGEAVGEAMTGYIYIAVFPSYEIRDDSHVVDRNGTEWTVVE